MAITNACRLADFGTGIGTAGAVIDIDNTNKRVGLGTTNPNSTVTVGGMGVAGTSLFVHGDVRVVGVITADNFSGSASGLSGLQWTNNASGIHTTKSVGVGTTRPDSIARVNNTAIFNAGIVTAYELYGTTFTGTTLNAFTTLEADSLVNKAGTGAPELTQGATLPSPKTIGGAGGLNITGVSTITQFGSGFTVAGDVTITGDMTVNGDTTTISATNLDVEDKVIGIASTSSPSSTTADGAGFEIYGGTTNAALRTGNKSILWQNDTGCFEFSEPQKVKGVTETVGTASTYMAGNAVVMELDVANQTTFTHSMENVTNESGIGIVSFKNLPTDTGVGNAACVTVVFTQQSTTPVGKGNTLPQVGIGTSCIVSGWENGAKTVGIVTTALVGSATTVTLSDVASDHTFVSFFVHYSGGSNTDIDSFKVYANSNGSFRQGNFQQ